MAGHIACARRPLARPQVVIIALALLLMCPSWSNGFHVPSAPANSWGAARQRISCTPVSPGRPPSSVCLARTPRHRTRRGAALVVCAENSGGGGQADTPLGETRTMRWDDDAVRDAGRSMDEKKSLRIAQLRVELQDVVRAESYAEAAILQEQIQALERTIVRQSFDQANSSQESSSTRSGALVLEDESMLSPSRGPMQRRPMRSLVKEPTRVLTDHERRREDEQSDALFYREPRLVTHVDIGFALRLQELYKKRLLPGSAVLDLGAACVSYLPEDVPLRDVVGLGMNMEEMQANDELTTRVVHDLNANPELPFGNEEFDAVLCASAIQYFTQPEAVLAEAARVLRTGGIMVIAFTDKCLASKALVGWKERGNLERTELVLDLVRAVPSMTTPELIWDVNQLSAVGQIMPSLRDQLGGDPLMAIVAYKGSPPAGWMMQVDQTNLLPGPFKKLSPFAAMYMIYLLVSHAVPL